MNTVQIKIDFTDFPTENQNIYKFFEDFGVYHNVTINVPEFINQNYIDDYIDGINNYIMKNFDYSGDMEHKSSVIQVKDYFKGIIDSEVQYVFMYYLTEDIKTYIKE